jgi:hypothetical protein
MSNRTSRSDRDQELRRGLADNRQCVDACQAFLRTDDIGRRQESAEDLERHGSVENLAVSGEMYLEMAFQSSTGSNAMSDFF